MATTKWLSDEENRAWRSLQTVQMRLSGELASRLAAATGLSYQDYAVLVSLTDRPDGQLRLFELARDLGWEKSRLSHHIGRMVKRGLVEKRTCPSDRRGAFVEVTSQGRREIEAAAPGHVAAVRELFVDILEPEQLAAIADAFETVLAAFGAATSDCDDDATADALDGAGAGG